MKKYNGLYNCTGQRKINHDSNEETIKAIYQVGRDNDCRLLFETEAFDKYKYTIFGIEKSIIKNFMDDLIERMDNNLVEYIKQCGYTFPDFFEISKPYNQIPDIFINDETWYTSKKLTKTEIKELLESKKSIPLTMIGDKVYTLVEIHEFSNKILT